MVNNTLIFVRHGKTKVDKSIPIENWILTEDGEKSAKDLANNLELQKADLLFSSTEKKAYLTLEPLANKIKKKIIQVLELGEIRRPNSEKLTSEQYEEMKNKIFNDLDFSRHNWETANDALKRFKGAVSKIDDANENKTIIICAHGTVLTLYFADLRNELKNIKESLGFSSHAIVKNGKVIKDFEAKK